MQQKDVGVGCVCVCVCVWGGGLWRNSQEKNWQEDEPSPTPTPRPSSPLQLPAGALKPSPHHPQHNKTASQTTKSRAPDVDTATVLPGTGEAIQFHRTQSTPCGSARDTLTCTRHSSPRSTEQSGTLGALCTIRGYGRGQD